MGIIFDHSKGLIENTTKEERKLNVKGAIAIGSVDSLPPSKAAMVLMQKYIDGEMEIDEIQKEVIINHDKYLD